MSVPRRIRELMSKVEIPQIRSRPSEDVDREIQEIRKEHKAAMRGKDRAVQEFQALEQMLSHPPRR